MKVIGQRSQSQEENVAKVVDVTSSDFFLLVISVLELMSLFMSELSVTFVSNFDLWCQKWSATTVM